MMRCAKYENSKRSRLNEKRGVESVTMMTNIKLNRKNGNSPRSCQQQSACSHSTPAKKPNANANMEESPDLYSPSPILPPCTQEGGNEVAWDWQIPSLSRTPESRNKRQNVQCETPKGTKLLQRKRNSNSPLLYKPLKRKTIKMENIENIGKFAAELQALNERMRVIKQNEKSHSSNCVMKEEAPTLSNANGKEKTPEIKDNQNNIKENDNDKRNSVGETSDHNDSIKKEVSGNYGDLFDDSVDDDMIRCTQEIEEKFNLIDQESSMQVKKEESFSNDVSSKTSVQFSSNENCKKPFVRSILGASANNTLKTYSKLSMRRDENSSIHAAAQRRKEPYKPYLNNNNTIQSYAKKPCDNKKLPKSNTADLFDFSDDSFDDWLGTGIEDEKLLSQPGSLSHKNDSTKFQANYKRLTNAPLKSEAKSADSLKPMAKPETSNVNYFENRKFFKTKSLSDQYVNRDANANAKGTTNASCYSTRPTHLNSSRGSIPRTSVARTTVSTKPIVTNDHKLENNAISLMRGTDRTHGSDINRCAVKSDGDRFVKHHSTGNMKNDKPEMTKTGSQPARCTAEEIERKRLQAVARLEARRKLYLMKFPNNIKR